MVANGPPYLGDMRHNYPPDTPLDKILEFEVWDGQRWVSNKEQPTYPVQMETKDGT